MIPRLYVLDGKTPVPASSILEWGECMQSEARIVARSTVIGAVVSTVFLGVDHNHFGGEPILFETMIFGGPRDMFQQRYCCWEEAERGHAEVVNELQGAERMLCSVVSGVGEFQE